MKKPDDSIQAYFTELDGKKGDLHDRCEQYSRWTVSSVFPHENPGQYNTQQESEKGNVAIGARLVNHLAHRIVDTMFPNDKPFFAIQLNPEAERKIVEEAGEEGGDGQAILQETYAAMSAVENAAMQSLNLTAYRPVAVNAVIQKIVTGNALIRRMDDDSRVVYSVRDYVCRRDISGKVLELILRDSKQFGELDETIQLDVRTSPKGKGNKFQDEDDVMLYTYFVHKDGKWWQTQAVEDVNLEEEVSYKDADFPCIPMAWNLGRGDHYGRGLVEDYTVSFHNIDVLTSALIDMIGIAADVKFLVDPASGIDLQAYNEARRGEYVAGKKDDVSVPAYEFGVQIQYVAQQIEKLERELAQAFLLQSAGVRDAERVTAEEIRFFAREIESAFGGLYSRLALDWQRKEAEYQLSKIDFDMYLGGSTTMFDVRVTTGLESLSREGKLDSLRMAIMDMGMLEGVPEDIRAVINPLKFAAFIFRNRTVAAEEFLYTATEFQQVQQQKQQQEQQLAAQQGEQAAAAAAVKE